VKEQNENYSRQRGIPFVGVKPAARFSAEVRLVRTATQSDALSVFNFTDVAASAELRQALSLAPPSGAGETGESGGGGRNGKRNDPSGGVEEVMADRLEVQCGRSRTRPYCSFHAGESLRRAGCPADPFGPVDEKPNADLFPISAC